MVEYLSKGITKLSRSQAYSKRQGYLKKATKSAPKAAAAKTSKVYQGEDVKQLKKSRKVAKQTKLRSKITPGTVLILLAGKFSGKRVVFLKQLESGLLLVTGPYKLNGVPLKRVNQSYVIATSAKVDISSLNVEKFDDSLFKRSKDASSEFFEQGTEKPKIVDAEKKKMQVELDTKLISAVKKTPLMAPYLRSSFTLRRGQVPHRMNF